MNVVVPLVVSSRRWILFGLGVAIVPVGIVPYRRSEAWSVSRSHSLDSCSRFALR